MKTSHKPMSKKHELSQSLLHKDDIKKYSQIQDNEFDEV